MTTPEQEIEYVTVMTGGQLFGLPIARVLDVFTLERLTRVPLAPPEVAGVLNLRGRIVTAIDLRQRLSLPPGASEGRRTAVGIEHRGESYGLLVDSVGEVMKLPVSSRDPNPANLGPSWAHLARGVHQLPGGLMVVLDVDRILELPATAMAA
jgi:purine-binding chemotaxis protein CheW